MKGDAIKHVAATLLAEIEPTDKETADAVADAVEIVLAAFADLTRIADALEAMGKAYTSGVTF